MPHWRISIHFGYDLWIHFRLPQAGEFKVLNDEGMVGCELLGVKEGIIGAEDIHFTPGGLAFITSDDRCIIPSLL